MSNNKLQILISATLDSTKSASEINSKLKQLEKKVEAMKIGVQIDTNKAAKKISSQIKEQMRSAETLKRVSIQSDTLLKNGQAYFKSNTIAAKKYAGEWEKIVALIKKATDKTQDAGVRYGALKEATAGYRNLTSSIKAAGDAGDTILQKLGKDASKFLSWTLMSGGVMTGINSLRQMIENVKELDAAIVDLRMATGGTFEETTKLVQSYNALAQKLGATTIEVTNAASDWLRQGKTLEETNTLIENSMVLSKVGAIDSASATQYLTTAMKGYGVATENTLSIVDKLSAVDMVSATSAGGLAEGMSEVANNAKIAGVEMDKLLGYLAIIGETTGQSMSSVGNSLSTMFSRMGNIKLSRLTDYETGEDLSNVETVLRGLDIQLRDSHDTFRNFGDVLDEVGSKWSTYSDVNKRAVASSIAGKDHMENFLVLMDGYSTALGYANVATESSGTAMEKMKVYQESVEASTKRLEAAFEKLSDTFINGGLVKGVIDFGTQGTNALTGLIDLFGSLGTAATVAVGVIAGKTNSGRAKCCPSKYAS